MSLFFLPLQAETLLLFFISKIFIFRCGSLSLKIEPVSKKRTCDSNKHSSAKNTTDSVGFKLQSHFINLLICLFVCSFYLCINRHISS